MNCKITLCVFYFSLMKSSKNHTRSVFYEKTEHAHSAIYEKTAKNLPFKLKSFNSAHWPKGVIPVQPFDKLRANELGVS